ncbi:HAMP domain-containing histidine kinase [Curtobacterium sp. Csp1]|uniref:histidine kinase n=2 Tax=Curtobacterium TaxID=2034 RepID=A0ABT2HG26_9MICO|nr:MULTISPECIES: HAMP domain-containing sensor histidine kinase [Curtobacterium]MCS6522213.1 HAMP domain-containing histidine kinase [Curtobacterium citreum]QKS19406.1 HAMP domain-containing histidine kinase [Curtobacterium sp. Csp1]RDI01361.1 two-component system OmpR family sensor kinase [Curtobacterium sp. AG1037]TQJ29340.1 two-component system OmpR family sensor kinase [Curtobacterium citreum]
MHTRMSRWWDGISLRTKITGITVLLVALGLLVAGLGTMTVLSTYLMSQLDNNVKQTTEQLEGQNISDGEQYCKLSVVLSQSAYVAAYDSRGDQICQTKASSRPDIRSLDFSAAAQSSQRFSLYDSQHNHEWRAQIIPASLQNQSSGTSETGYVLVAVSSADTDQTIARFTVIFLGFGISVILLGAMLTRLLVTATFDPLRDVEDTAARFAAGDFNQRLEADTPNTEVGRLNRSLNAMLERIDSAFEDRERTIDQMRRFVGDASHELRTPLVSLRGYAELYRMGALRKEEDVAQAMERIEKEAQRMGLLVQDLLQLARIDESKPLELGPVDLVAIARDSALDTMASNPDREIQVLVEDSVTGVSVAQPVRPTLAKGDTGEVPGSPPSANTTGPIAFSRQTIARLRARRTRAMGVEGGVPTDETTPLPTIVLPARPPIVLAEENKIRQVVTNLMGNAMRFTEHDDPIEIGIGVDDERGMAHIDVIDHGEGIPPQLRDKIFQRFWRADTSRARDTGGSGLGLAIVSGIVQAHHGSVEVFDTEGGGATFRVWLPLLPRDYTPTPTA